jgi:putative hydrolase of the HAD superfamily
MSASEADRITYWLLPEPSAEQVLSERISSLAAQVGAPVFSPHVTIYAGTLEPVDDIHQQLRTAISDVAPVSLRVIGIRASERLSKTLYLQFEPSAVVAELSERLRSAAVEPSDYQLDPHLSLLYAVLTLTEKERLAELEPLQFEEITFNRIQAYRMPARFDTPEAILSFDEIATFPLEVNLRD